MSQPQADRSAATRPSELFPEVAWLDWPKPTWYDRLIARLLRRWLDAPV
jgi:hypothetical protein